MRKKGCLLIIVALILSTVGGCSLKKSGKEKPVTTLNMGIIYSDKAQGSIYKEIARDYQKINDDKVKVNIITDYGDQDKVKASLTSTGDMDLLGFKRDSFLEYSKQGYLRELTSALADNGLSSGLYPISLAYGEYLGKNYGIGDLPMVMEWFYNPKLLANYKLETPATLDDLLKDCKKLNQNGIIPIGLGAMDGFAVSSLFGMITANTSGAMEFSNAYGSKMDAYRTITGMNTAFKDFGKLCANGILSNSDEINYRQSVQDFVNGKSAFLPAGSFAKSLIDEIKPANFKYDVLPSAIAFSDQPVSLYSASAGQIIAIAGNSRNGEEAEKFLKFIFSGEEQKKFTDRGYISSLKKANSTNSGIEETILSHITSADQNSIMLLENLDSTMLGSMEVVLKDMLGNRIRSGDAWNRVLKNTYRQ